MASPFGLVETSNPEVEGSQPWAKLIILKGQLSGGEEEYFPLVKDKNTIGRKLGKNRVNGCFPERLYQC